jgi:hypothetical protein
MPARRPCSSFQPEHSTTRSPFWARPAATFIRTVPGLFGAGWARFSQKAPSRLIQQSISPSCLAWLGWLWMMAAIVPSPRRVRFGHAQTLSTAM